MNILSSGWVNESVHYEEQSDLLLFYYRSAQSHVVSQVNRVDQMFLLLVNKYEQIRIFHAWLLKQTSAATQKYKDSVWTLTVMMDLYWPLLGSNRKYFQLPLWVLMFSSDHQTEINQLRLTSQVLLRIYLSLFQKRNCFRKWHFWPLWNGQDRKVLLSDSSAPHIKCGVFYWFWRQVMVLLGS